MLRLIRSVLARHVTADARRLKRSHGSDALFVVRRAVLRAERSGGEAYWTRVLTEIEGRMIYRPW